MTTLRIMTFTLALLLAAGTAQAVWIGATSGTTDDAAHDYTNTNNWENFVIDDVLPNTFTANTQLRFKKDHATGTNGLTLNYQSRENTLGVSGDPRTLTLNGNFTFNGDNTASVVGYVRLDLGGELRVFANTGNSIYRWYGDIVNGGIVKEGSGRFAVYGSKNFDGPLIVNAGSFYTQQTTALNFECTAYVNGGSFGLWDGGSAPNTTSIVVTATKGNSSFSSIDMHTGVERLDDEVDIVLASAGVGDIAASFTHRIDDKDNDAVERVGRLIIRSGQSKMIHGVNSYNLPNMFIRLNAGEIVRENKSTLGVYQPSSYADRATYSTAPLGMRREVEGLNKCGNQLFLDTPPALCGGPLTARGTDAPVIPFILGANFVTNGNPSTALNTLMTYDAAGGMRAMRTVPDLLGNPTEFVAALAAADADGKDNVRIASDQTLTGEKAVNALALTYRTGTTAAKLTLDASARLTVGSGLLAFVGGSLDAQEGSVIDVGEREGVIFGNPTVAGCLAGAGGYTFSAFNGTLSLTGTNAYSGQTTLVSGTLHAYRATATPHNDAFPDDGFVLIHPGATLRIGDSTTSDYRTREVIGSLGGGGRVQLGYISDASEEKRRGLVIGAGGTGTPGAVVLDNGTISPGMPGEVGTLSVTTEANAAGAAIPVRLKKGTIEIDIAGPGVCDVLSTLTNVNISAGGGLVVDVDVGSFQPRRGQEWTIIVSESGPITDGNGGTLLDAITDNSDRVNFTAAISEDKTALVLTAIDANAGTVLMVR